MWASLAERDLNPAPPKMQKTHGLVSSLGRQLNGCVGTIVRVDAAAKRYAVNVDKFSLKSIKPENLELIIEPLNRDNSGG